MRNEGYNGLGRARRRAMIKQWKREGGGLSLNAWARKAQVGDAAYVWLRSKRGKGDA